MVDSANAENHLLDNVFNAAKSAGRAEGVIFTVVDAAAGTGATTPANARAGGLQAKVGEPFWRRGSWGMGGGN